MFETVAQLARRAAAQRGKSQRLLLSTEHLLAQVRDMLDAADHEKNTPCGRGGRRGTIHREKRRSLKRATRRA
jgi:hypothetical protein